MVFLEIPRQRARSRRAEEEVQASGPVAPGGPARLLERVPPGAAAQMPARNRRHGLPVQVTGSSPPGAPPDDCYQQS